MRLETMMTSPSAAMAIGRTVQELIRATMAAKESLAGSAMEAEGYEVDDASADWELDDGSRWTVSVKQVSTT